MADIAIIGTGLLGSAIAEAAAKRGDSVTAWNRSPDKARALADFGIRVAVSAADAVRGAQRVHLIVKDDAAVEEVIGAMRSGLAADAVVIDHSTTLPEATAARMARLAAEGMRYLHCPVFMTPMAARATQGSIVAAGPRAVFDAVADDLAKMTGRLEYLGERGDAAAATKLFGNALILSLIGTMADMLALARGSGMSGQDAIDVARLFDLNAMVATRGGNMAAGRFVLGFELAMARKDLALMLETAGSQPLSVLPGIASRMDALIAAGRGSEDVTILGDEAAR